MKKYILFFVVLLMIAGTYTTASADVKDGKKLFKKYCVKCHGADGSVSEYGRAMKGRQARDLRTNKLFIAPKELLSIIKYGLYGREMKGWQLVLKDDEILSVAAYVRTFEYKPDAEAGKKFFDIRCSSCHSEKGAVKMLFKAPDLDMSSLGPVEMGRVIRFGRHGTMMSPKKDLFSNSDVADVVEYLQSIKK